MRILVYKQTHLGDPDQGGAWRRCMGRIRLRTYDAVIGFGGYGPEPQQWGIAEKLTWIGIGPQPRYGIVRFEHFRNFGNNGPLVKNELGAVARQALARKLRKLRHAMIENDDELERLVERFAGNAPASCDYDGSHSCCHSSC